MKKSFPLFFPPISRMCGFPVVPGQQFYLTGHYYRLNYVGMRIIRFLVSVVEAGTQPDRSNGWLLPYRSEFRRILRIRPAALLSYLCQKTPHEGLRCLAIWLRGRCEGTLGMISVAMHRTSSSVKVRKEVARALRRMRGWDWLRDMEKGETSAQILRLAHQREPGSFDDRLTRFLRSRCVVPGSDIAMDFFVDESVDLEVTRPKSPSLIRAILERIRRLFRGEE